MIRGKYLRERKVIRFKRRMKLLTAIVIVFLLYKVIFSSFSLYESEASSSNDLDIAFFVVEDKYEKREIPLDEMIPGETKTYEFSVSNFIEEGGVKKIAETEIQYNLKIRTTTNMNFEYELYKDQNPSNPGATNIVSNDPPERDDDLTYFKYIYEGTETFQYQPTDTNGSIDNYVLKIKFPAAYDSSDYQNIIDCIEITVDAKQVLPSD